MTHSFGALLLPSVIALLFATNPAFTADYADCKAQAIGMGGDARQKCMSSCQADKGGDEESENRQWQAVLLLLYLERQGLSQIESVGGIEVLQAPVSVV